MGSKRSLKPPQWKGQIARLAPSIRDLDERKSFAFSFFSASNSRKVHAKAWIHSFRAVLKLLELKLLTCSTRFEAFTPPPSTNAQKVVREREGESLLSWRQGLSTTCNIEFRACTIRHGRASFTEAHGDP